MASLTDEDTRVRALRDKLEKAFSNASKALPGMGPLSPGCLTQPALRSRGWKRRASCCLLDQAGVCASSGSACTTGSLDPSHVLLAMGCSAARARGSIRLSLGIYNTEAEVDDVLDCLPASSRG